MKSKADLLKLIKAIQPTIKLGKSTKELNLRLYSEDPNRNSTKGPLPDFSIFPNLESLELGNWQIDDISSLPNNQRLRNLRLEHNEITDYSPISKLNQLTELYLSKSQSEGLDLDFLRPLTKLKSLTIQHIRIQDISALKDAYDLEHLRIWNAKNIKDISCLADKTKLKYLDLSFNRIRELTSLSKLTNLRQLRLAHSKFDDISPLSNLSELENLVLSKAYPKLNLNPLIGLKELRRLDISDIKLLDISAFSKMNLLENLSMNTCSKVQDFDPLAGLKNIRKLDLVRTRIQDLSPVAKLQHLNELHIDSSRVRDLSPLSSLTNLKKLTLTWTKVKDLAPIAKLTNLQYLSIAKDLDVSPVQHLIDDGLIIWRT